MEDQPRDRRNLARAVALVLAALLIIPCAVGSVVFIMGDSTLRMQIGPFAVKTDFIQPTDMVLVPDMMISVMPLCRYPDSTTLFSIRKDGTEIQFAICGWTRPVPTAIPQGGTGQPNPTPSPTP